MQDSPESKTSKEQKQELLLKIVETWNPSQTPEYRGFRCGNCMDYKNEAWYHWLNAEGYRLAIHLCDDKCELAFQNGTLKIEGKEAKFDRTTFGSQYEYSDAAKKRFREIVASWPEYEGPKLKAFVCDDCGQDLTMEKFPDGKKQRQGYHVWWKMPDQTLTELHFHRDCANKLDIH